MPYEYKDKELSRTGGRAIPLNSLVEKVDKPFYFYDGDEVLERAAWFDKYSRAKVHFAMKSNSEMNLLKALAKAGYGVDVVSFGEVDKALRAGFSPESVIYSGVAKSETDLIRAFELNIGQINVESISELRRICRLATSFGREAKVALRLNLAMDVPTHPYIQTSAKRSKFGVPLSQLDECLQQLRQSSLVQLVGLSAHIGSQIMELPAFQALATTMKELTLQVQNKGFALESIDLGGGLGIDYGRDEDDEPRVKKYLETLALGIRGLEKLKWQIEPGRILSARSGVLVAKVEYVKPATEVEFLILNTGTHHFLRPALYGALHRLQPLRETGRSIKKYDIVGLLCESSDSFAKNYSMPEMMEGEWLAIRDAGAYGRVMASCYNESPWPPEIVVLNNQIIGAE